MRRRGGSPVWRVLEEDCVGWGAGERAEGEKLVVLLGGGGGARVSKNFGVNSTQNHLVCLTCHSTHTHTKITRSMQCIYALSTCEPALCMTCLYCAQRTPKKKKKGVTQTPTYVR